jgi:large subunit ribosomal protein L32
MNNSDAHEKTRFQSAIMVIPDDCEMDDGLVGESAAGASKAIQASGFRKGENEPNALFGRTDVAGRESATQPITLFVRNAPAIICGQTRILGAEASASIVKSLIDVRIHHTSIFRLGYFLPSSRPEGATIVSIDAIMAALHNPSVSFLSVFLPVARASLLQPARTHPLLEQVQRRARKAINNPLLQHLQRRANNALNPSLLPAIFLPIPTLLGELWDGLLKAVPKKKTSHMKKRHRQMASGKALKDVTALNTCSSCGRQKRAHVLCEYCVKSELHFPL